MKTPEKIKVTAGTKAWCTCGKSAQQPYCDGSHTQEQIRFRLSK